MEWDFNEDDDDGGQWAEHELSLQHLQLILQSDPGYALWLDRIEHQSRAMRDSAALDINPDTHWN